MKTFQKCDKLHDEKKKKDIQISVLFSVTALLVGEKLPPEAEIDVSYLLNIIWINQKMAICRMLGY